MADKPDETGTDNQPEGISEDDLRSIIGEVVEEKLGAVTETLNPANLLEEIKGLLSSGGGSGEEGTAGTDDSLLERIGTMIDEKLANLGTSGNGEKKEHVPKLRVF